MIKINAQFSKQISLIRGVARTILWQLQTKKKGGTIKINPLICAKNRYLIKNHVNKLKTATICVAKNKATNRIKMVKRPLFSIDPDTATPKISYSRGVVNFKFSKEAQTILRTKQYFEIDLDIYTKLRSQCAKLFYEMLCRFRATGRIGQLGSVFKQNIGMGKRRFKSIESFEKLILHPTIREIETKTSFKIDRTKEKKLAVKIGKFVQFSFTDTPKEVANSGVQKKEEKNHQNKTF